MNTKKQLFFLLCAMSSAVTLCSDEFKKKTTDKPEKSSAEKTINKSDIERDATLAFMATTVLPLAKKGTVNRLSEGSHWHKADDAGRQYTFFIYDDYSKCVKDSSICWRKNSSETESKLLPLLKIENTDYTLEATQTKIALSIKSGIIAKHEALFAIAKSSLKVEFPEITSESIKAKDFLEKRYASYIELYTKAKTAETATE